MSPTVTHQKWMLTKLLHSILLPIELVIAHFVVFCLSRTLAWLGDTPWSGQKALVWSFTRLQRHTAHRKRVKCTDRCYYDEMYCSEQPSRESWGHMHTHLYTNTQVRGIPPWVWIHHVLSRSHEPWKSRWLLQWDAQDDNLLSGWRQMLSALISCKTRLSLIISPPQIQLNTEVLLFRWCQW